MGSRSEVFTVRWGDVAGMVIQLFIGLGIAGGQSLQA
jgi:hypothetical protein